MYINLFVFLIEASYLSNEQFWMDFSTEYIDIKLLRMMMQTFYNLVQLTSQLKDLMQIIGVYCINTILHLTKVIKISLNIN